LNAATTNFEPLLRTGNSSGEVMADERRNARSEGDISRRPTQVEYVLAAHITGRAKTDDEETAVAKTDDKTSGDKSAEKNSDAKEPKSDNGKEDAAKTGATGSGLKSAGAPQMNVILVADIDMLASVFFDIRARRQPDSSDMELVTDNVPFVLNAIDYLAGDMRFIDVRSKRPKHRALEKINEETKGALDKAAMANAQFEKDSSAEEEKVRQQWQQKVQTLDDEIQKMQKEGGDQRSLMLKFTELSLQKQLLERNQALREEQLRREKDQKVKDATFEMQSAVSDVQRKYKLWSVCLPPLLPLAVAFFVYFHRRTKEREGVSKARLR
jgi:ABC-2 type transport system permease protein